jgi:hypothetical protein
MPNFTLPFVSLKFSPIAPLAPAAPVDARPSGRGADSTDRPACTGEAR